MEKGSDIFDHFQQSLNELGDNLRVLETTVPVEKQMEYFRYSEKVRRQSEEESVDEQIETLLSSEATINEKRYALTVLAISGDVKAFRTLEEYSKQGSESDLKDWISMALLQARITLESEFSEEKQVFISTGLGGNGNKLRFYAFFQSNSLLPFLNYQRKLIEKEIPFFIHKYQGELEEICVEENYFYLVFLINLQEGIRQMLEDAINECNEYGNFINSNFIITNVKRFDQKDIDRELGRNR
ncbi:MAG: hypothetical protein EZS26_003930 [Candidatus Ordinivivax streblomastigis]|uniref:Uncharacterized protein n=1 Tax=Candidatus Ordinivivax streblomastigis TaxID=2540710 RepID=A0A5M8NS36_9BACT|nr:MAG: hypothetical protein EZS26_003930 [Candidatus Ordinivivax streblomastigis]